MTQVEEAKVLMTKLIDKVESLNKEKSEVTSKLEQLQEKYDKLLEEQEALKEDHAKQIEELKKKVVSENLEGELKEIMDRANATLDSLGF